MKTIMHNIRFFFDDISIYTETGGNLYIDANKVCGKVCHSICIWKSPKEIGREAYDISDRTRDMTGRLMNDTLVRYFKLTCCRIFREERYYLGKKKVIFYIDMHFVDESARAHTDIRVEFPNRALARKYLKVVKEGLGIKKGFIR